MSFIKNKLNMAASIFIASNGLVSIPLMNIAKAEEFNTTFLAGEKISNVWKNNGQSVASGIYDIELSINGIWAGTLPIKINDSKFYLKVADFNNLPIVVPQKIKDSVQEWFCITDVYDGVKTQFNSGRMKLDITIPQAYILKQDKNWIAPEQWDRGISALYTNYNANYYKTWQKDEQKENFYASLNSGVNILGFHLIDNSTWQKNEYYSNGHLINNTRYIERPVEELKSIIRYGKTYTESPWFDSFKYNGLSVTQEKRMYPDAYNVYMPVVEGTATTASVVKVYQNGNIIYQTNVPPGPFAIRDLMPTGSRSNLNVIVENNGHLAESFTVPFTSISDMLRADTAEWYFSTGDTDIDGVEQQERFFEGSIAYGLNNYLTTYGGWILSKDYQSLLGGVALAIPFLGSFSFDTENANSEVGPDEHYHGQRYKLSYSRYFSTKTNLTLAAYYYNTDNYLSYSDQVKMNDLALRGLSTESYSRSKQSFNIHLQQPLPDGFGNLALDGYWKRYWNSDKASNQYSITWSGIYQGATLSVSGRKTEYIENTIQNYYDDSNDKHSRSQNSVDLSISIPFDAFEHKALYTSRMSLKDGKFNSIDNTVSGSTKTLDYNLTTSLANHNSESSSVSSYVAFSPEYAKMRVSATKSGEYKQLSIGANGSALLSQHGLLTSNQTGNTFVIIEAPGAKNAMINSNERQVTNNQGKVLIPSAVSYRLNNYRLDIDVNQENDTEVMDNISHIVPYKGSVTYLRYKTDTRHVFTLDVTAVDHHPLPFGASAYHNGKEIGYVTQGSRLYIKSDNIPNDIIIKSPAYTKKGRCHIIAPTLNTINICK